METKFINCNGCRFAYFELNEQAPYTIFFIHGNSVSKRCWRKQYESPLLSAFRMIAIDLPAHGESGAADEKNCTLPALASVMCKVVKALSDDKPFILAGISLSTNIIAEMLAYDIKPTGLLLAGPCIAGKDHLPDTYIRANTHVGVVFSDIADDNDLYSYARETSLSDKDEDIAIFLEDYKSVQLPFRSLLAQSIAAGNFSDEIALVRESNIPSCVIFGKDELIIDADYLDNTPLPLWNNTMYKIAGAGHLVNIDQPEQFNPILRAFADDIFK